MKWIQAARLEFYLHIAITKPFQSMEPADLEQAVSIHHAASCQHSQLNHQSHPSHPLTHCDSPSSTTGSTPASYSVNTTVSISVPLSCCLKS